VWVGKLRPEQETEVLERLQTATAQVERHNGAHVDATLLRHRAMDGSES
jgi:hypothetical protein